MPVQSESIEFKHIGESKNKNQIILCETKRNFRNYVYSLRYRYNGKNPYLPNYVISREGEIIEIIKPNFYSKFMNNEKIDKNSIIVCLENYGWLEKKPIEELYLNWIGDIYKEEVFEKRWRDKKFWHPYNKQEQINSLVNLLFSLCEDFNIPLKCAESNVFDFDAHKIKGILSKSSFDLNYKDLNPSFDFKLLQKQLKNA
jgi:hypothetical protein